MRRIARRSSTKADSTGLDATFRSPRALAVDAAGNLIVGDPGNFLVCKDTPAGG